ncbi:MAG: CapA family protein [Lysobacterales bacterium]
MKHIPLIIVLLCTPIAATATDPWPWVVSADGPDEVDVLLMGDSNFQFRDDPGSAWVKVQETLAAADIRFLNLEGPFAGHSTDPHYPDIPHKSWTHSEPRDVQALVAGGIDAVGLANNVTFPWQAAMKSIEVLDQAGIPHTGAGQDIEAAHRPVILERKGTKVGFLQFAATVFPYNHAASEVRPGIAGIEVNTAYQPPWNLDKPGQPPVVVTWPEPESLERMSRSVRELASAADVAIVSFHWGVSGMTAIVEYQRTLARAALDAGADLVFGHGSHEYQQIEVYKGKPIVYSLAQFVFDDPLRAKKHRHGHLARAVIREGELVRLSLVPSWREDDNNPYLLDPNEGRGRELLGAQKAVLDEDSVPLIIEGQEIVVPLD